MPEKSHNKVIFGGNVLIDLTGDTVSPSTLLSSATAHDKSGKIITGTCTYDSDTSNATAVVAEILSGKTAYARGSLLTGTMPNIGVVTGTISTVSGEYTIPQGYHDGSGKVSINSADQAKIIASNIRAGITILGVTGTMSGSEDVHAEIVSVTPSVSAQTITPSTGYNYISQVNLAAIPYVETENAAGGLTVTIAG